ncbi:MAG: heme biosynthesis HemY N-terminal domain-containing protein [Alphaproteobacteria bacterium]|nr:heme biosynthesis HemY N-terminal domain-containing protein [Alphaproteobacteria bacterium]
MSRLLRVFLQVVVFAALAYWLADRPGTARIVWHDTVIETSAAFLALCVLALGYTLHLLFSLWHFIRNGPALWRMRRKIDRMQSGQNQLTRGLVAIASGNSAEAGRLAVSARKNAENEVIAQWLQAQAARMAGDKSAAQEIFRTLAAKEDTAVLGYRGLITEAKQNGDWQEVDRLLDALHTLKPETPWLSLMRMESAARHRRWSEAEAALSQAVSAHLLDTAAGRRTRAALRIASSRAAAAVGDKDKALQAAEQAVKQSPEWLPAILNLAETLAATNHHRAAMRTIERAWKTQAHPQLARIVLRMADTPLEGFRQTEKLCRSDDSLFESRVAMAEAALAADIWGEARRNLVACVNNRTATQGVYKMLSRLERMERRDERAATMWLTKAAEAAPDPVWMCRTCCGSHENWMPICGHCGAFDSLEWRTAGKSRVSLPSNKDFLNDD